MRTTARVPSRPAPEWLAFPAGAAEPPEAAAGVDAGDAGACVVVGPPDCPGWVASAGGNVVVADPARVVAGAAPTVVVIAA
ncbi:MAG TPA: hypothetical protein VGQ80_00030, partial [Acidimicrobiia bacterium]|nr:hypothetical protein [Acidimicrobiia bacterium]